MVSVFDILHRPFLCQNLPLELHMHSFPNILASIAFFFLNFRFHLFIRFELIHIDQHKVSFKLLNGYQ
jgi:hypothetical protein